MNRNPAPRLALALFVLSCYHAAPLAQTAAAGAAPAAADPAAADQQADTVRVVVSARKRDEAITDVPMAITSFSERSIADHHILSFIDYAAKTPNLSFAYGNGGTAGNPGTAFGDARTIAIRGIAGARTTGFYIDDTPLPGAVDVRIVDLQSIEVLKGPQGTLFGESSLGGNVRLITKAPSLQHNSLRYGVEGGITSAEGGVNSGAQAVANFVLAPGSAALRLVAYADDQSGYLQRSYRSDINNAASSPVIVGDQGAQRNIAGSATALLRLSSALDLTLRLAYQNQFIHGFPATYAPLPAFKPVAVADHVADIQPLTSDIWTLPSVSFKYHGSGWTLSSSTSLFQRRTRDVEDSTEGTASYWGTTIAQGFAWNGTHRSRQLAHETRVAIDPVEGWSGTFGLLYSKHKAQFGIDDIYAQLGTTAGTPSLIWRQLDTNTQQDTALFGEVYYKFADRFTLTAGLRKYWLRQHDDLAFAFLSTSYASTNDNRTSGTSPKLALAWQHSQTALLYASAAKGFRQGNAQFDASGFGCEPSLATLGQTPASMTKIDPDAVWSYEAGGKLELPDPGLLLSASVFRIHWDHIQQPLFLQSCGFYMQGNAGAARIDGFELEAVGRLTPSLKLRAGLGYADARISESGNTGQQAGSRVFQVPKLTASLSLVYSRPLGEHLRGFAVFDASHAGSSLSANSGAELRLERAAYSLLGVRLGVAWQNAELALGIRNLGNARPNLGDIGYVGYQRYVPGTSTPVPQVATLPPRTVSLQYSSAF